jgi:fimbrial chaperone protein
MPDVFDYLRFVFRGGVFVFSLTVLPEICYIPLVFLRSLLLKRRLMSGESRRAGNYIFFLLILFALTLPSGLYAGSFNVLPVKVHLSKDHKTENLKVKNESTDKVTLQVSAFEWSQDETGKDTYRPTEELVYFPRIFTLEGNEERLLKLGYQKSFPPSEKSFRIYLEELPEPQKGQEPPTLKVTLKMGIPVFISPLRPHKEGRIEKTSISKGMVTVLIRNTGNAHLFTKNIKITGVDSSGNDILTASRTGWYVLSGKTKSFPLELPKDKCKALGRIRIAVETDTFTLNDEVGMDAAQCGG